MGVDPLRFPEVDYSSAQNDFGARQMPCGDFNANALYFDICSLSYNLFALILGAVIAV
jgi:hypothetical protein